MLIFNVSKGCTAELYRMRRTGQDETQESKYEDKNIISQKCVKHDSVWGTVLNGLYQKQVIGVAAKPPSIKNDNPVSQWAFLTDRGRRQDPIWLHQWLVWDPELRHWVDQQHLGQFSFWSISSLDPNEHVAQQE